MEIETKDVDCGQLHVSSSKVKSRDKKNPASTQCSRLWPNLYLKDSANENSAFIVRSVAP